MVTLPDLAPDFLFLYQKGFVDVEAIYSPQAFGNARIVLSGTSFDLRFDRDRSVVTVEIGGHNGTWDSLAEALHFIDPLFPDQFANPRSPPDLYSMSVALQRHWWKVCELYNSEALLKKFRQIAEKRAKSYWKHKFPNWPI